MVPLAVVAAAVLFFLKEKPLATAVEHDVLSESIAEGNVFIADDDEVATATQEVPSEITWVSKVPGLAPGSVLADMLWAGEV
ncbi:MAG: transporter [Homoserinimonas sp.]|jgi:hypothetical protein|nr:transporter [Homoserinimonas sp.]